MSGVCTMPGVRKGGVKQPRYEGGLTKRQLEVVKLIAVGFQDKEVADKLCISVSTVKAHLLTVYELLGFKNRYQLIVWAFRKGFVT